MFKSTEFAELSAQVKERIRVNESAYSTCRGNGDADDILNVPLGIAY